MSIATAIAVSGINAASLQLQVSAGNIANSLSDGNGPLVRSDDVAAATAAVSPALVPAYRPTGPYGDARAFAASPYTRLTNDMVRQLVARFDLIANTRVLLVDQRTSATMLDLLA